MYFQGPVPLDSEFYSDRDFETEIAQALTAGRWVLLLGPRQHGKSSALLRVKASLRQAAMTVAYVDLQKSPPCDTYAQLVGWFVNQVATELGVNPSIEPNNDLSEALAVAVPNGNYPVIILIDEASNIQNDQWRNSFYGQLRAIATERGDVADDHVASRVRFVFSGTFREEKMVAEENSPFNTCDRIDSTDLAEEDVKKLLIAAGVSEDAARKIFAEVGGQPFLIQRLGEVALGDNTGAALDEAIGILRSGNVEHVRHLFRRVLEDEKMSSSAAQMVRDGSLPYEPGDDDQRYLIVLGLVKLEDRRLVFRNALYRHIASFSPQLNATAGAVVEGHAIIFAYPPSAFGAFNDGRLAEIACSAQAGAVGSFKSGSNRLALAGFGNALEAILLDYIGKHSAADIATAASVCKNRGRYFDATDPSSWSLADMMRGARKLSGTTGPEIPESLRDWRNLVHPSVCLTDYRPDDTYKPEVIAAVGLFGIVLRDLR